MQIHVGLKIYGYGRLKAKSFVKLKKFQDLTNKLFDYISLYHNSFLMVVKLATSYRYIMFFFFENIMNGILRLYTFVDANLAVKLKTTSFCSLLVTL